MLKQKENWGDSGNILPAAKVSQPPGKLTGKDCCEFFEIQFIFHYFSAH
jgi:hypothetical protein